MPKPSKLTIVIYDDDGGYRVIEKIKQPPKRAAEKPPKRVPRRRSA